MDSHHLRLIVDYAFSQLRSGELTEEVLRTLTDISKEFPVSVFTTFVNLWAKASTVHLAHKKRLCRALSEAILPHCASGSLSQHFSDVKQLVGLVLNFSDEAEAYDACLQRLAAVDGALFSLVSEQIFARLSLRDVSYAVPLVSLRKIAAASPGGVKASHGLWFTNVLACLSGGVCTDKSDVTALADLTVAVIDATATINGQEQLLSRIFECFYDLMQKHIGDVAACVCFLNVLSALVPVVPEISLHIRKDQLGNTFLSTLKLFVTSPKLFELQSETLIKFLSALKRAILIDCLFPQPIREPLFPLIVRIVTSDAKTTPIGIIAADCVLGPVDKEPTLAKQVEEFIYEKVGSRREEDKASAIWLADELTKRHRGSFLDGRFCDAALTAHSKSPLILAAVLDFARTVRVLEISDKVFNLILERSTTDEAAFNVALTFKESSTRMWRALWPRLTSEKVGLWKLCALINVIFDKEANFLPEEQKAKVLLWLLIHLGITTDIAQKRAIAETYSNLIHHLSHEAHPEIFRLMDIGWQERGGSVELQQMFEQLKNEPDQLSTLFNAVFSVLTNFEDVVGQPEIFILEWFRLFGVTLAFAPTAGVAFSALEKLVNERPVLLAQEDARIEVGKIFAELGIRFPVRTLGTLATMWTQAETMKNQNSFLALFQPQNAVHAVYMQGMVVAARTISGTSEHLKILIEDLTINADTEISEDVIAVLSRAISDQELRFTIQADKAPVERLTGFFIARLANLTPSTLALARPCLLALPGLLEIYAERKFVLEISVLSETLSAVLRVLLADDEEIVDLAGNFHAAGRLFVALVAVSQSPELAMDDERISVTWKCLASLMQTVSAVIGNITVLRPAAFHLLETLANAAPPRLTPAADVSEAWGVCVAVVWGGMGESEISEAAIKAVKQLRRRNGEFETCDFQVGEVSEVGKLFVKSVKTRDALIAVTREVANQTIAGSRMSGNLLLEILNRSEVFGEKYSGELASQLFEKNGNGNFSFLRKLLKKNFECVFDTLFLSQPLSAR